jgi:drug/metabolite transporter (DMT)-like permease
MPLTALALVVFAAFTHASWNLLAKRAVDCRHFNWYYSAGAVVLWLPLAWYFAHAFALSWLAAGLLLSTAILHALYSAALMRGYRAADLSVVYPIARGTGPLLSFIGAIFVLSERPSVTAAIGALLVVAGVFMIAGGPALVRELRAPAASPAHRRVVAGVLWGTATGCAIAAYTLNDGYAVKLLAMPPVLLDYASNLFRTVVFVPIVWRDRALVRTEYPRYWKAALGVSVLGPLGYILVLQAMTMAPVSHVAPARELSMMIGTWFGARLLGEGGAGRRVAAAALIVLGVVALALG